MKQIIFNVEDKNVHLVEEFAKTLSAKSEKPRITANLDANGCFSFSEEAAKTLGVNYQDSFVIKNTKRRLYLLRCPETDFNAMTVGKSGTQLKLFSRRFVDRLKLKPGRYPLEQDKKKIVVKI